IHRDIASLLWVFDVGCLVAIFRSRTPARDLSEFGVLAYRVGHRATFFGLPYLLPPCNPHSSSNQQVLWPAQAEASDQEDPQSRQRTRSSVSSTRRKSE